MTLVRWNPYSEIDTFRRQFDRLLGELADWDSFPQKSWHPAVELHDGGENLLLKVELPGFEPKDLDITVTRDAVTIKGEQKTETKEESKQLYYSEFRYGTFTRTVQLPVAVQNDQVKAEYANGILNLTLPKVAEAVNRAIKINLGTEEIPSG